jgi:hypothetical protein
MVYQPIKEIKYFLLVMEKSGTPEAGMNLTLLQYQFGGGVEN